VDQRTAAEFAEADRDCRLAETQFLGGARRMAIGMHSVEDTQETQIDLLQAGHHISTITFFNDNY